MMRILFFVWFAAMGAIQPPAPTPTPAPVPAPTPVVPPVKPEPDVEPPIVTNTVEGLELPADFAIDPAKHTIFRVPAKSSGIVQFFVFGTTNIEYDLAANSVIVGVPREASTIVIIATALITTKDASGKLTDAKQTPFVRTVVSVSGPGPAPSPNPPGPGPAPTPTPKGKLFGMIVEDPSKRTAAIANLINSVNLRSAFGGPTNLKVLDPRDPYLQRKPKGDPRTFDAIVKTVGLPAFLVLDETGKVYPYPLPPTEADAIGIANQVRTGGR